MRTAAHMELQELQEPSAHKVADAAGSLRAGRAAYIVAVVGKTGGTVGDRVAVAIAGARGIDQTLVLVVPEPLDTEYNLVQSTVLRNDMTVGLGPAAHAVGEHTLSPLGDLVFGA